MRSDNMKFHMFFMPDMGIASSSTSGLILSMYNYIMTTKTQLVCVSFYNHIASHVFESHQPQQ